MKDNPYYEKFEKLSKALVHPIPNKKHRIRRSLNRHQPQSRMNDLFKAMPDKTVTFEELIA
ncbi:MAG: hypothetical protein M2R45_00186 [Verrucomicrobia subdivision 3 bacterium]|nr:hypothetical protein [Limisphaerales bacterium]MCS1412355.1 hypothetical protein [Limisphaerales bacterium]